MILEEILKGPLAVALVIIFAIAGVLCVFIAIIGKIPRIQLTGKGAVSSIDIERGKAYVLGVFGLFLIGLAIVLALSPKQLPQDPILTPTETLVPPTSTSIIPPPTETSVALATTPSLVNSPTLEPTPTIIPGQDFSKNCISEGTWEYADVSLRSGDMGCIQLPGVSVEDGDLTLFLSSFGSYNIHTPIARRSKVTLSVVISSTNYLSSISIGIVPREMPQLSKGIYLSFESYDQKDAQGILRTYVRVGVNRPGYTKFYFTPDIRYNESHKILFELDTLSLNITLDGRSVSDPIALAFDSNLWISYHIPDGGVLSAQILDLTVK